MKKYPKNILFLDYDGCMTSIDNGTYFNVDPKKYHWSEDVLEKLISFCMNNDVKIVLTSNWRKFDENGEWHFHGNRYLNPLPNFKKALDYCCFDVLSAKRHVPKLNALKMWFDENPDFNGGFVVFDDDIEEGFQNENEHEINKHFMLIDAKTGITEQNLADALECFKNKKGNEKMTFNENERLHAIRNVLIDLKGKLASEDEHDMFQIVFTEKENMKAYKFTITPCFELKGQSYDKFIEFKHYATDMLNWSFDPDYVDLGIFEEKNSYEAEISLKA